MSTSHFEFHVSDTARAKKFYATVLGWTFQPMQGMEAMDYHLVNSPDIGVDKQLSGALMKRNAPEPAAHTSPRGAVVTFTVADVDAAYAIALASGGGEALPPTDYEGIGRVAYCEDGEGNIFGMITAPKGNS